jgi:hypothetical protein
MVIAIEVVWPENTGNRVFTSRGIRVHISPDSDYRINDIADKPQNRMKPPIIKLIGQLGFFESHIILLTT